MDRSSMAMVKWVMIWFYAVSTTTSSDTQPRIGKFLHVTDFHYDHTYKTFQLSCNAEVDNPAPLGDYWCDSPWRLVTATIDAMVSKAGDDVDFVLWTGDTIAHISNDNMTVDLNMEMLQNLTDALMRALPNIPVFPAYGNHDYYPASQFPATGNIIYNLTAEMWRQWIEDETQLNNFRTGGYYTLPLPSPASPTLRVVVLNTNLYYTSDKATPGIDDPTGQLRWLRTVLTKARAEGEKVIVAAHIPPGVHTPRGVLWYQEAFVDPVYSVLAEFSDVIKAMNFGHDHHDGFKVFYSQDQPAIPIFVSPSVTPWRYKLSPDNIGLPHNPTFRFVTYDRDTGDHLNIEQYYLDLAAFARENVANFTLLYSFTEHYGVQNVSARSLQDLVTRMSCPAEGDTLLDDYYRFSIAGAETNEPCDRTCKDKILCGFRFHTRTTFDSCTQRMASLQEPPGEGNVCYSLNPPAAGQSDPSGGSLRPAVSAVTFVLAVVVAASGWCGRVWW